MGTKYIDADALIAKIFPMGLVGDGNYTINAKAVKLAIDNIPAADVVEVVRCKDCAHYQDIEGFVYNGKHAKHCVWHSALRYDNDYCSDGMRKKEGEE